MGNTADNCKKQPKSQPTIPSGCICLYIWQAPLWLPSVRSKSFPITVVSFVVMVALVCSGGELIGAHRNLVLRIVTSLSGQRKAHPPTDPPTFDMMADRSSVGQDSETHVRGVVSIQEALSASIGNAPSVTNAQSVSKTNSTSEVDLLPYVRGSPAKQYLLIVHGGDVEALPSAASTDDFSQVLRGAKLVVVADDKLEIIRGGTNAPPQIVRQRLVGDKQTKKQRSPKSPIPCQPSPDTLSDTLHGLTKWRIIGLIILVVVSLFVFGACVVVLYLHVRSVRKPSPSDPHATPARFEVAKFVWPTVLSLIAVFITAIQVILKMMGLI